ncbi:hypothetical protein [Marinoscillum sp.]|uniref:hypothetical protein n=1 Tax=Marinoscillum sp. TaxID=2024838 RepID=UPI003BAA6185
MKNLEPLYKTLFHNTNGFVLNWPIGKNVRIGDFFSMSDKRINVVGNIYDSYFQLDIKDKFASDIQSFAAPVLEPFIESVGVWESFVPLPHIWQLEMGCDSNYLSKKMLTPHKKKVNPPEVNQYITTLSEPGSFFLVCKDVQYLRMPHFKAIRHEVIRRLTTEFFNFNKIFLITEIALIRELSYGVSKTDNAEVIFSLDTYPNGDLTDLLISEQPFDVERAVGLEHLKLRAKGGALAFKAKKMQLSLKARDILIREIAQSSEAQIQKYAVNLMDSELFHLFPKIEINPANANEFFEWTELSLEDVEHFLGMGPTD